MIGKISKFMLKDDDGKRIDIKGITLPKPAPVCGLCVGFVLVTNEVWR